MSQKRSRDGNHLSAAEKLEAVTPNFDKSWWGEIELTDAVRPTDPDACLHRGFATFPYHGQGKRPPVISVNETRSNLFLLFMDTLSLLGDSIDTCVDVWLMFEEGTKKEFVSYDCELVIVQSKLWDMTDLWLNSGAAGIAICKESEMSEIHLDDHKSVLIYAGNRKLCQRAKQLLHGHGLKYRDPLNTIWQMEHCHCTDEELKQQFQAACLEFNASPYAS